jgi:hypothetical protein
MSFKADREANMPAGWMESRQKQQQQQQLQQAILLQLNQQQPGSKQQHEFLQQKMHRKGVNCRGGGNGCCGCKTQRPPKQQRVAAMVGSGVKLHLSVCCIGPLRT